MKNSIFGAGALLLSIALLFTACFHESEYSDSNPGEGVSVSITIDKKSVSPSISANLNALFGNARLADEEDGIMRSIFDPIVPTTGDIYVLTVTKNGVGVGAGGGTLPTSVNAAAGIYGYPADSTNTINDLPSLTIGEHKFNLKLYRGTAVLAEGEVKVSLERGQNSFDIGILPVGITADIAIKMLDNQLYNSSSAAITPNADIMAYGLAEPSVAKRGTVTAGKVALTPGNALDPNDQLLNEFGTSGTLDGDTDVTASPADAKMWYPIGGSTAGVPDGIKLILANASDYTLNGKEVRFKKVTVNGTVTITESFYYAYFLENSSASTPTVINGTYTKTSDGVKTQFAIDLTGGGSAINGWVLLYEYKVVDTGPTPDTTTTYVTNNFSDTSIPWDGKWMVAP